MIMSEFPQVLTQVWKMDSSDLCVVGQHLGYDWNQVCEEIGTAEFYAQDGDGTLTHDKGDDTDSEVLNAIMNAIYEAYPNVKCITISN